jgi:hypothetical protein
MQLSYRYNSERDRALCLDFLRHSGFWNDIEVEYLRSATKRLVISIENEDVDDFTIRAKYKGFKFNEIE